MRRGRFRTIVIGLVAVVVVPVAAMGAGHGERARARLVDLSKALDRARQWIRGEDPGREIHPIRAAQQALTELGYDPGPADGVMGPQTREAVRRFQQNEGLKVTGRLDADTMERLGAARDRG